MIRLRFGLRGAKYLEFVEVWRRSASSLRFSLGVTALYVRKECCQQKYQNVLVSAGIVDSRYLYTLKYAKLGSRRLVSEKLA
jgi:hypothetical protein